MKLIIVVVFVLAQLMVARGQSCRICSPRSSDGRCDPQDPMSPPEGVTINSNICNEIETNHKQFHGTLCEKYPKPNGYYYECSASGNTFSCRSSCGPPLEDVGKGLNLDLLNGQNNLLNSLNNKQQQKGNLFDFNAFNNDNNRNTNLGNFGTLGGFGNLLNRQGAQNGLANNNFRNQGTSSNVLGDQRSSGLNQRTGSGNNRAGNSGRTSQFTSSGSSFSGGSGRTRSGELSGNSGLANAGQANAGLANAGQANAGIANAGQANAGLANSGFANSDLSRSTLGNSGLSGADLSNTGLGSSSSGLSNSGFSNFGLPNTNGVSHSATSDDFNKNFDLMSGKPIQSQKTFDDYFNRFNNDFSSGFNTFFDKGKAGGVDRGQSSTSKTKTSDTLGLGGSSLRKAGSAGLSKSNNAAKSNVSDNADLNRGIDESLRAGADLGLASSDDIVANIESAAFKYDQDQRLDEKVSDKIEDLTSKTPTLPKGATGLVGENKKPALPASHSVIPASTAGLSTTSKSDPSPTNKKSKPADAIKSGGEVVNPVSPNRGPEKPSINPVGPKDAYGQDSISKYAEFPVNPGLSKTAMDPLPNLSSKDLPQPRSRDFPLPSSLVSQDTKPRGLPDPRDPASVTDSSEAYPPGEKDLPPPPVDGINEANMVQAPPGVASDEYTEGSLWGPGGHATPPPNGEGMQAEEGAGEGEGNDADNAREGGVLPRNGGLSPNLFGQSQGQRNPAQLPPNPGLLPRNDPPQQVLGASNPNSPPPFNAPAPNTLPNAQLKTPPGNPPAAPNAPPQNTASKAQPGQAPPSPQLPPQPPLSAFKEPQEYDAPPVKSAYPGATQGALGLSQPNPSKLSQALSPFPNNPSHPQPFPPQGSQNAPVGAQQFPGPASFPQAAHASAAKSGPGVPLPDVYPAAAKKSPGAVPFTKSSAASSPGDVGDRAPVNAADAGYLQNQGPPTSQAGGKNTGSPAYVPQFPDNAQDAADSHDYSPPPIGQYQDPSAQDDYLSQSSPKHAPTSSRAAGPSANPDPSPSGPSPYDDQNPDGQQPVVTVVDDGSKDPTTKGSPSQGPAPGIFDIPGKPSTGQTSSSSNSNSNSPTNNNFRLPSEAFQNPFSNPSSPLGRRSDRFGESNPGYVGTSLFTDGFIDAPNGVNPGINISKGPDPVDEGAYQVFPGFQQFEQTGAGGLGNQGGVFSIFNQPQPTTNNRRRGGAGPGAGGTGQVGFASAGDAGTGGFFDNPSTQNAGGVFNQNFMSSPGRSNFLTPRRSRGFQSIPAGQNFAQGGQTEQQGTGFPANNNNINNGFGFQPYSSNSNSNKPSGDGFGFQPSGSNPDAEYGFPIPVASSNNNPTPAFGFPTTQARQTLQALSGSSPQADPAQAFPGGRAPSLSLSPAFAAATPSRSATAGAFKGFGSGSNNGGKFGSFGGFNDGSFGQFGENQISDELFSGSGSNAQESESTQSSSNTTSP